MKEIKEKKLINVPLTKQELFAIEVALDIHYNSMIDDNGNAKRKECKNFTKVLGEVLEKISSINHTYGIYYGIIKEDEQCTK